MNFFINIPPKYVRFFLWLSQIFPEKYLLLVCKGYDDDWENYTGLYWADDKDLEIEWYEDYQLWINVFIGGMYERKVTP